MKPTIGRIVHYKISAHDAEQINRRRHHFETFRGKNRDNRTPGEGSATGHIGHYGNYVSGGGVVAATIVRVHDEPTVTVNLQVHLDGNDTYWATSRAEGDAEGQWSWPPRA